MSEVAEPTEKKHRHLFGIPTAPLYTDVVKDMRNAGRAKLVTWESSVMKYIRPFAKKAEWKETRWCYEVVGTMRLMANRYDPIKKVIETWDGYDSKQKARKFSLDKACDEAGVDRDEFAGLALAAVKADFRAKAESIVVLELDDVVKASMKFITSGVKESSPERMRHMEKHGVIDKQQAARISLKQTNNAPAQPTRSFDDTMSDFDKAIDGEILGETRLLNE